MFTSALNERSRSNPLCDFRLGTVVTSDHETPLTNHEDHIAGKGENSLQHYNLVHKFIPMLQAMKIPAAKAAVDKEWEKLEKISAWNLTKVQSKKEVIDEARTSGATVHFASLIAENSTSFQSSFQQEIFYQ